MSIMESLTTKGKELTQKTKDLTEQTKIKNQIKSETEKIESLYQAIGKLYYENMEDSAMEPYADIIKTIKIAMEKIKEYEAKGDTIKQKYVCPQCGAPVTVSTHFCKSCGAKITNFSDIK